MEGKHSTWDSKHFVFVFFSFPMYHSLPFLALFSFILSFLTITHTSYVFESKLTLGKFYLVSLFFSQIFFFFFFSAALGLGCCTQAFSSCGEQGLLRCGARASHCSGFSCCRAWGLGTQASVVAALELSNCGMRALEHVGFSCCGAWALGHAGFSSCGAQAR